MNDAGTHRCIIAKILSGFIELECNVFQLTVLKRANDPATLPSNVAVLIGRDQSCHIQLRDPSASRVHCRVIVHDGRVALYDAGSRWGTFVNGQRVTECDLRLGDQIQIGETTLQLSQLDAPTENVLVQRDLEFC